MVFTLMMKEQNGLLDLEVIKYKFPLDSMYAEEHDAFRNTKGAHAKALECL